MGTFNLFRYKNEEVVAEESASGSQYRILRHRMTKKEMEEVQEEFRRQKEIYESRNKVLMSEERKRALYR
jgi:hypothetical protein